MSVTKKLTEKELTPNEIWRTYLVEGHQALIKKMPLRMRPRAILEAGLLKVLPSDPRCIWCYAPFHGLGSPLMRAIGKDRSKLNPSLCSDCEDFAREHKAGADVEVSLLFADVRGSTALAEKLSPGEFTALINRFYSTAGDILVRERAFIDKLIGDEVSAFFVPGLAGKDHAQRAINAAKLVLRATGHKDSGGPWAPVGIGVHTGEAFVGAVGSVEGVSDITVLGDAPNTAARIASMAKSGEILVSEETAQHAELDTQGLEKRELDLKGKSRSVAVWVLDKPAAA